MIYRQPFRGEYRITQRYGQYIEGVTVGSAHTGIDYDCPIGTEILASADGTVMAAGWDLNGFGFRVIIRHEADKSTLYAHLDSIGVNVGQQVKQGDVIGLSGWSGNVVPKSEKGRHLHFEARVTWNDYKSHRDPVTYLPLMSVDDSITSQNLTAAPGAISAGTSQKDAQTSQKLKGSDAFRAGDLLRVQNTLGVRAFFDQGFSYSRVTSYPQGTPFYFTGDTIVRKDNGLTYMRVVPAQFSVWIAVHDGETQLLDK